MKPMASTLRARFFLPTVVVLLFLQVCATPTRHTAVPEALQDQAIIPGLEEVRHRILKESAVPQKAVVMPPSSIPVPPAH